MLYNFFFNVLENNLLTRETQENYPKWRYTQNTGNFQNVNSIWWILKHMISWPVEVIRGNTENIENLNFIQKF